jgi:hypothetical protein
LTAFNFAQICLFELHHARKEVVAHNSTFITIGDCFSLNMMQGSSLGIMPCPHKQVQLNFPIDGITHICWTIKIVLLNLSTQIT